LKRALVENNTAMFGSGVYVYNSQTKSIYLNDLIIHNNSSPSNNQYGAITLNKVAGTFSNSIISENNSGYYCGGLNISYSDLIIDSVQVLDNISTSGIGGNGAGLHIYDSNIEIFNSDIIGNR